MSDWDNIDTLINQPAAPVAVINPPAEETVQEIMDLLNGKIPAEEDIEREAIQADSVEPEPSEEPEPEAVITVAPAKGPRVKANAAVDVFPDLSGLTCKKLPHRNMVLDDVASHCAHCGMKLTDAVSIQRGIGPVCSKKGYMEESVDADPIQAMIDLAEFPELVSFLNEHYKPLGTRGLLNGLVRVASLNRPRGTGKTEGNWSLFDACCEAIDSLGNKKLAELLRHTLVAISLSENPDDTLSRVVWVMKKYYTPSWSWDIRREISGQYFSKMHKGILVPFKHSDGTDVLAMDGIRSNRQVLWTLMKKYYKDLVLKLEDGRAIKITPKKK